MAGNIAPFTDGMLIFVPVIFTLMGIGLWRSKDSNDKPKGLYLLLLGLFGLAFGLTNVTQVYLGHKQLAELHAENIKSIQIEDKVIDDHKDISRIIAALSYYQRYIINHEAEPDNQLLISLDSGKIITYSFMYKRLRKQEGVVVSLQPGGYIFSTELQTVFNDLEITYSIHNSE